MYRFLNILILLAAACGMSAQEISVSKFEPLSDVQYGSMLRPDLNGIDAALIKVQCPVEGVFFDGSLIGDPQFRTSEYWVWLEAGQRMMDMAVPGYKKIRIFFDDYGVGQVQSKAVYLLDVTLPQTGTAEERLKQFVKHFDAGEYDKAMALLRPLAEAGMAKAEYNMGICYEQGHGVTKDYAQAIYWYQTAADHGMAAAYTNVGHMYISGKGVPKDHDEAKRWYRKAAEAGDPVGQCNLGYMLEQSTGEDWNTEEIIKWYSKAAEQGNAQAQNNLGNFMITQNGYEAEYDLFEAFRLILKSAEQGNQFGMRNVGNCFFYGTGVQQDKERALQWYQKAADKGNTSALYEIAEYYIDKKDYKNAYEYYLRSAEAGNMWGQCRLGRFLLIAEPTAAD